MDTDLRHGALDALIDALDEQPALTTCRTYFRSVSEGSPRSAATCAIGRPDSNTTRVARSNSSTGYFL